MDIKQEFITPNKYTRPQIRLQKVKKIAIHYTGDIGATAQNEHDYFNGTCIREQRYASCHYLVGLQGEKIQIIPDNELSYCTNQANAYSINIETCYEISSGKFNQITEKSLIELAAFLCRKYGLNPINDLIRHYDVTGKVCPKYYVDHPDVWNKFKQAVKGCMNGSSYTLPSYGSPVNSSDIHLTSTTGYKHAITTASINMRSSYNLSANIMMVLPKGKQCEIINYPTDGWVQIKPDGSNRIGYCVTQYLELTPSIELDTKSYIFNGVGKIYQFIIKTDSKKQLYVSSSDRDIVSVKYVSTDSRGQKWQIDSHKKGSVKIYVKTDNASTYLPVTVK
ncbi:putative N-acetylmuramoyl-L-alanine amidase [Ruminococcaceae bacterium BL-6]|nr:putative N-acetylmuramoyl-L-alanine amidase [Ruminococcaceae bacterium BL-6]